MGGQGSGGWNRKYDGTTDGAKRLDIAMLSRNGIFKEGRPLTVTWSTSGMIHLSLTVLHQDGRLLVGDASAMGSAYRDPLSQFLPLSDKASAVGRRRAFFECRDCGARCQHLYLHRNRFICRKCAGLTYKSQRERDVARSFRRWDEVSARLGGVGWSELGLEKPKHMDCRTFERLREQLWAEEQFVEGIVMAAWQ